MKYGVDLGRTKKIYYLFFVLLLIETFFPAIVAYAANVTIFIYTLYRNKGKLTFPFRSMKYLYIIVALGMLLGLGSLALGRFETRDYVRDVYYFTNPVFMILNGAYLRRKLKDDHLFFNTIVFAAGVQALIYLTHAITIVLSQGANISFRNWRLTIGDSSALAAAAIVILLIDNRKCYTRIKRGSRLLILTLCILEILVSLSRTNILLVVLTSLVIAIQRGVFKNIKKWLKYIALTIVVVALAVVLLGKTDAVTTFVEKTANSIAEISNALDWSNAAVIQGNWRGYETHCALVQFGAYPTHRQLIGYGFGERIEVGIYANLFLSITNSDGSASTSIPVLHNGYSTMLCKLGIVGIILYLAFYISLIKEGRKQRKYNSAASELLVAIVIALAVETYILNGLFRENVNFPYIYMIGYLGYALKYKEIADVFNWNTKADYSTKKMAVGKQT